MYIMESNEIAKTEILYREQVLSKGEKRLTYDDKLWLQTHAAFSKKFGYPYLSSAVVDIEPNIEYQLNIRLVKDASPVKITPTVRIPMAQGFLRYKGETVNQYGRISHDTDTTLLSTMNNPEHPEVNVSMLSELGKLNVYFHANQLPSDVAPNPAFRFASSLRNSDRLVPSTTIPHFAMLCEKVKENMLRFSCSIERHAFSCVYVFDVEWLIKEGQFPRQF